MALSLYDVTITEAKALLQTLDHILTKAESSNLDASKLDGLPQARLYDDMKPLSFQIYTTVRFTEKVVARLSNRPAKEYEDNLRTFPEMHARIAEGLQILAQADKDTVNRVGEEVAPTDMAAGGIMEISGRAYALGAAMPNISFHVNMAYAILRKEGVPLGKGDYIMPFVHGHISGEIQRPKQP